MRRLIAITAEHHGLQLPTYVARAEVQSFLTTFASLHMTNRFDARGHVGDEMLRASAIELAEFYRWR